MTLKRLFIFTVLLFITSKCYLQVQEDIYLKPGYQIIYEKNYMYQIKAPSDYNASVQTHSIYDGHVKFLPISSSRNPFEFYILDKTSSGPEQALKYITDNYKMKDANVIVKNIEVKNLAFTCTAKMYSVDNKFYDYLFYLNCGDKFNYWVVASAHSEKKPLSSSDLEAFFSTMTTLIPIK